MSRISVHIVTWNSRKVLEDALESLRAQTFKEFSLVVVDNASTDGSVDCVREHFPEATVLRNFKNLGFSHAHDQAIEMSRKRGAEWILVMNPDIVLTPDFLKELMAGVKGRPEIGSAGGKLLRVRARASENDEPDFTDIIDSTGLAGRRSRRFVDRGSGEKDAGQYDEPAEVFGISGAATLYRREALDDAIAATGEAFDEDFFAYKEDVDLAWRLRLLGWKSAYVPTAVGYHYRAAAGVAKAGPWRTFLARRSRSALVNRLSTRNQLLMIVKNEDWSSWLLHLPFIAAYELAKFLTVLFTAPRILPAYAGALALLPKMLRKRRKIRAARKTPPKEIRKWFR